MASSKFYECDVCKKHVFCDYGVDYSNVGQMVVICKECTKHRRAAILRVEDLSTIIGNVNDEGGN